jgi:hypothetical protein
MKRHGLTLDICERPRGVPQQRWYAHFSRVEWKDGGMLCAGHGNGDSQRAAVSDYLAQHVTGRRLVKHAMRETREEFDAPNEITIDLEFDDEGGPAPPPKTDGR